jgi:MFS transporter, YNFM family, putative membrane transport protein
LRGERAAHTVGAAIALLIAAFLFLACVSFAQREIHSLPDAPSEHSESVKSQLWLLGIGGFVSGTAIRIAEPMLPKLAEEFAVTGAGAASVITAFALSYGLFQLVHGPIGDRFGKLRTIAIALCLAGFATIACATATSLESLAFYRFLAGMTAGAVIPLSFAFIGDNIPFESRQAVLGQFISGILIGGVLGPLLGGVFSDLLGWRYTFWLPGIAFIFIGALLGYKARHERVAKDSERAGVLAVYATLLRMRSVRTICMFVAIESFLFQGGFAYLGVFMRETYAFSFTVIGLCIAGMGLGGLGYSSSVKWLMNRLGQARMVLIGGVILALMYACIAAGPLGVLMAPLIIVGGYAFNMLHNTLQTFATEMAPGSRGAAVALFAFALFFGQALGVSGAGVTIETFGYAPTFIFAGVGLAILGWRFSAWITRSQVRAG